MLVERLREHRPDGLAAGEDGANMRRPEAQFDDALSSSFIFTSAPQ